MSVNVVKFGISGVGVADLGFLSGILSLLAIFWDSCWILEVRQSISLVGLETHELRRRRNVGFVKNLQIPRSWLIRGIFNDIHTIFLLGMTKLFESLMRRISDLSFRRFDFESFLSLVGQIWSHLRKNSGRIWILCLVALDLRGFRSEFEHLCMWAVVFWFTCKLQWRIYFYLWLNRLDFIQIKLVFV